jgi:RNA polymerase sigma-70 factor (ECF subfamily)
MPVTTTSDTQNSEAILREVAGGDCRRFDVFVNSHKVGLMSYLVRQVGDRHRAEDLAQEVFLKVFRAVRAGQWDGRRAVKPWLFTIAHNSVKNDVRTRRRRPIATIAGNCQGDELPRDPPGRAEDAPSFALDRTDSDQRVSEWLALLPEDQEEVVRLKIFADMTFAEMAGHLGIPIPTLKSRMAAAVKKLQNQLFPDGETR